MPSVPIALSQKSWLQTSAVPDFFDASGAFETCRVRKGKVLHLAEHLRRLQASLQTLALFSRQEGWEPALRKAAREVRDGYIRVAVNRAGRQQMIIHRHPGIPYSHTQIRRGISLTTVASRWPQAETGLAQVKHSERLSGVLARIEGKGAAEVLRVGPHGYLTEGTASNLFLIKDGILMTPPTWLGVLEGVTRTHIVQGAGRLKIPVQEVPLTRHDLFNADEAFLTNVLMGILPIHQVDGRRIGIHIPGPLTRRLMRTLTNGKKLR